MEAITVISFMHLIYSRNQVIFVIICVILKKTLKITFPYFFTLFFFSIVQFS